jgi:hypothetical protein
VWAGVDKVWEQKKPEAKKMPVNHADSHTSGARFVGRFVPTQTAFLEIRFKFNVLSLS